MVYLTEEQRKTIYRLQLQAKRLARSHLAGSYASTFHDAGIAFEEVRPYLPGDEIRRIDWNVTARMHQPFIKSFREERERTVWLILDIAQSLQQQWSKPTARDRLNDIAAVLCSAALQLKDRVGLILAGNQIERCIPPGIGLRHQLRILKEIYYHQSTHVVTNWETILPQVDRLMRRHSIVFWLSDFVQHSFGAGLASLSQRQELFVIQLLDPFYIEGIPGHFVRVQDPVTNQVRTIDLRKEKQQQQWQENWRQHQDKFIQLLRHYQIAHFCERTTNQPYEALTQFIIQQGRKKRS